MATARLAERLDEKGVARLPRALDPEQLSSLWAWLQPEDLPGAVRTRSQQAYGARGLLCARPRLQHLLTELGLDGVAEAALRAPVFAIDATFFDKRSDANWAVPAHQDVVVPVPSSADLTNVRHVRARQGVMYGEPIERVLRELVALRVSFDDSGHDNGRLEVVDGSHSRGRLSDADIRRIPLEAFTAYDCSAGDVLLMKPLAVHRSPRAMSPAHRRVLHVLYAPRDGWHGRHWRGRHDAAAEAVAI